MRCIGCHHVASGGDKLTCVYPGLIYQYRITDNILFSFKFAFHI